MLTKWPHHLPVVQIRVARPTNRLEDVIAFYHGGLGLDMIESFEEHAGYSGVMLGLPGNDYHLEFTEHDGGAACPDPSKDNLLVFYIPDVETIELLTARLQRLGYMPVQPENPYWSGRGVTFEDPDGWRIVLMNSHGLTAPLAELSQSRNQVGGIVTWNGAEAPKGRVLRGRTVRLEPMDASRHFQSLFEAASRDPNIWTYSSHGPFEHAHEVRARLDWAKDSPDHTFFSVVDDSTGRAEGVASYMREVPSHGVIEIGIWFGVDLQRTTVATEAIYLLLRHAFDHLGYRRVEWKCNALNQASRRAAERFGFTFEGIFRQHMVVKGRNRDTAWYAMLDTEWPAARTAFELWLSRGNFDGDGKQRCSLSSIRSGHL